MARAAGTAHSRSMQTIQTLLTLVPSVIFGVGTIVTIVALRRAPEGSEDSEGFHYRHAFAVPRRARRHGKVDTIPGGTRFA